MVGDVSRVDAGRKKRGETSTREFQKGSVKDLVVQAVVTRSTSATAMQEGVGVPDAITTSIGKDK